MLAMRAFILAAGRGERLRPLTDVTPKPLVKVLNKPLIQWHLEALVRAGIKEVVINVSWLAEKIMAELGDGERWGLHIQYSIEGLALESAGGIANALQLLEGHPFILVNADIWTDYCFADLLNKDYQFPHLVLVNNPLHHTQGDFALDNNKLTNTGSRMLTYSGISVFPHKFAETFRAEKGSIVPYLRNVADKSRITAEYYSGFWHDVGTLNRLKQLETILKDQTAEENE